MDDSLGYVGQHLEYSDINTAFNGKLFSESVDFKAITSRVVNDLSSNTVTAEDREIEAKIFTKFNSIRQYFDDNSVLLYNHQEGVFKEIKDAMDNLTEDEKKSYESEFQENFNFDSKLFTSLLETAMTKVNSVRKIQDDCEKTICTQNVQLNRLSTLVRNFEDVASISNKEKALSSLNNLDASIKVILDSLKEEKTSTMKKMLRAVYFTKFVKETISDTSLKSLTIYACPVCLENQVDAFISDCGHTGCKKCLNDKGTCPVCRGPKKLGVKQLYYNGQALYKGEGRNRGVTCVTDLRGPP